MGGWFEGNMIVGDFFMRNTMLCCYLIPRAPERSASVALAIDLILILALIMPRLFCFVPKFILLTSKYPTLPSCSTYTLCTHANTNTYNLTPIRFGDNLTQCCIHAEQILKLLCPTRRLWRRVATQGGSSSQKGEQTYQACCKQGQGTSVSRFIILGHRWLILSKCW